MNKKKVLILSILLAFIVILSSNSVFAEDIDTTIESSVSSPMQNEEISDNSVSSPMQNEEISDNSVSSSITTDEVYGDTTTSKNYTINTGSNSSTIQNTINSMNDGDVLNFEKVEYKDIYIY